MKIKLFHKDVRNETGQIIDYRKVEAYLDEQENLIIYCCDISNSINIYGVPGVEFFLKLDLKNKDKLATKLSAVDGQILLTEINKKFGNQENCFPLIMEFCRNENIKYEFEKW